MPALNAKIFSWEFYIKGYKFVCVWEEFLIRHCFAFLSFVFEFKQKNFIQKTCFDRNIIGFWYTIKNRFHSDFLTFIIQVYI